MRLLVKWFDTIAGAITHHERGIPFALSAAERCEDVYRRVISQPYKLEIYYE